MSRALAWPLAVVALALIFRPQLRALLSRISKGRLGPAEFEFEQQLQMLAAQSAGATGAVAAVMLSAGSARQAILAAGRNLEHRAQVGMQSLCAYDLALYQQLRGLRDQVSQRVDFSPSPEAAGTYVQLARGLQARMEQARMQQQARPVEKAA
ncbi:MAG: hypothetical protein RR311_03775 [Comamonas sp.]